MERIKQGRELLDLPARVLLVVRCRGRGREGAVPEADLSGGGAVSPTSRGVRPPREREGGKPLDLSREREGGRRI
jgi:hypothetical protein